MNFKFYCRLAGSGKRIYDAPMAPSLTPIIRRIDGDLAGLDPNFVGVMELGLKSCCIKAATMHARHNQMVACGDCKQVLKFFREARPMNNYLKFCATSRRRVTTGLVGDYFVVAFSF